MRSEGQKGTTLLDKIESLQPRIRVAVYIFGGGSENLKGLSRACSLNVESLCTYWLGSGKSQGALWNISAYKLLGRSSNRDRYLDPPIMETSFVALMGVAWRIGFGSLQPQTRQGHKG